MLSRKILLDAKMSKGPFSSPSILHVPMSFGRFALAETLSTFASSTKAQVGEQSWLCLESRHPRYV